MTRITFRTIKKNQKSKCTYYKHSKAAWGYVRRTDIRNKCLYVITEKDILYTGKPQYNKSEGTKDFVLYSRDFVIAGAFYYRINYRGT